MTAIAIRAGARQLNSFHTFAKRLSVLAAAAILTVGCGSLGGGRETPPTPIGGQRPTVERAPVVEQPTQECNINPIVPPHKADQAAQLVRIGVLLPFSASSAGARAEADSMLKAAQLALFDVGHSRMVLIPKDTVGTAPGARAAAISAIEDGADVILGPLYSANVEAVMSVACNDGPPVIAFSNDSAVAGQGAFLLGLTPENELQRLVRYAADNERTRIAALVPDTQFGFKAIDVIENTAYTSGAEFMTYEFYADGANAVELADPVRAVSSSAAKPGSELSGYNAIVMPEGGSRILALAPLLPRFDIDPRVVQFLGGSLWRDDRLLNEPVLDGAWFVAPDPVARSSFEASYFDAYGDQPRRLTGIAYDAVALVSVMTQAQGAAGITQDALMDPQGFYGSDGLFRFTPNGMAERALAVFEIRGGSFQVLDPAPQQFSLPAADYVVGEGVAARRGQDYDPDAAYNPDDPYGAGYGEDSQS